MPKMSMSASGDKADIPDPCALMSANDQSGHFAKVWRRDPSF